jgi:hypothetical protein
VGNKAHLTPKGYFKKAREANPEEFENNEDGNGFLGKLK